MSKKKKSEKLSEELERMAFEAETGVAKEETAEEYMLARIKETEAELADWKDKYLRSMAEFENFRRRSNQEKTDWIKLSTQKMALEVCDVADNFERALTQLTGAQKEDGFVKGVLLIEQQLRSVLEKEGVRKIEALGQEFDPTLHEALAHIPSEYDENLIAAVIQNGYMMNGKVLRPVRVAVSSGKIENTVDEPEPEAETQAGGGDGPKTIEIKVD